MIDGIRLRDVAVAASHLQVYRVAFLCAAPAVIVRDSEHHTSPGSLFDVTPSFATLLGRTRAEMQDKQLMDFVAPRWRERTIAKFHQLSQEAIALAEPFENAYLHADGSEVPLTWLTVNEARLEVQPGETYRIAFCRLRTPSTPETGTLLSEDKP